MSVSCRRRPRRQRRGGRGHSPPSRPPSRPGRGRGRFGACEAAPAAGPAGKRARGRGAALCARGRGAAGRWPGRLPLVAAEPRAGGRERGAGAPSGPPLGGARTSSILHGGLPGGGRGTQLQPPAPTLFLRSGSGAGVPGECPPSARGGMAGPGRFVCPGNPGTARRAGGRRWARARGLGQASRGDARQGRPPGTGGTDRSAGQWGWGQLSHLRGEEARSLGGRSGFGLPAVWFTRKECNHLAACGPWTCPEGGKEAFRIGLRFNLGWEAGRVFRALGAVVCENKELQSTHKS